MVTKSKSSAKEDYLQAIEEAAKSNQPGKNRRYSEDFMKMVVSYILTGIPKAHIQNKSKLSSSTLHRWCQEWEPKLRKNRIGVPSRKAPIPPIVQTLLVQSPENLGSSPDSSISTILITIGDVSITVSGRGAR